MTLGGNIPLNPYDIPMIVDDCWYWYMYIYISHFVFHFWQYINEHCSFEKSRRFGRGLRSRWRSPCEACAGDQAEAEQHRVF